MSDIFSWFGDLIEWLSRFIPRLVIVRSTHLGIKYVRGKNLVCVKPGLCFYWPLVTEMETIPAVRQTLNLPVQRLVTNDGKRVICSGVVVYNIFDIILAVGRSWDNDDTVRDISMGVIAGVITDRNYDMLQHMDVVQNILTADAQRDLRRYGVRVQRCMLTDFCPANVIALSTDNGFVRMGDQEE